MWNGGYKMNDLIVVCPQCKESHSEDRHRIIIKMGRYWSELINDQDKYSLLCKWCLFSLNEEVING